MAMNRFAHTLLPALLVLALPACGGGHEAAAAADSQAGTREGVAAVPAQADGEMPVGAPAAGEASMDVGGATADGAQAVTDGGAAPEPTAAPSAPGASAATAVSSPPAPAQPARPGAAPPAAPAAGESQDRAVAILRDAERAANGIRTLEADFVQDLRVPLLNQSTRSAGKMYQKRPDRLLMRFTDPAGDVMVSDGRHFWIYYPSADRTQVIRTAAGNGSGQVDLQRQFLSNPAQRYVSTLAGEESVGGRPAHVLTLVPRGASPYRLLKVWVDKQDHLVRRFEITEENESVRRLELRNLKVNGPVADNLFSFTPPPGTQVFDQ